MKRIIVTDSACDTNEALDKILPITKVAFPITLNGKNYLDDGNMDILEFIREIKASPTPAKTAGPSPEAFMNSVGDATEVFIITISRKLSGTFSNAMVAARELMENSNIKVHVFDSRSTSGGELAIAQKIYDLVNKNFDFEEIVKQAEEFAAKIKTFFVLEDLSTLVKSGRIPKMAGRVASGLSIIPICSAVNGAIKINDMRRGMKKALLKLSELVINSMDDFSDNILYITHCNNPERAEKIKNLIMEKANFKGVEILSSKGLVTTYANEGGIIVAY